MAGKLGAGGGRGRNAGHGGNGRPLTPNDNLGPEERKKAMLADEEATLISVLDRLERQKPFVDEAKAAHTAEVDKFNAIVKDGAKAKFTRGMLMEYLAKRLARGRKDQNDEEARRRRHLTWLGLPIGETDEMTPQEARDGIDWETEGYRDGVRAIGPRKPPPECPERFTQHYLSGWDRGQERNAWALNESMKPKTVLPDTPIPPPANDGPVASLQDQAPLDGRVGAELDRLAAESAPRDPPADGFEASPEELAKQTPRRVAAERKAAEVEAASDSTASDLALQTASNPVSTGEPI